MVEARKLYWLSLLATASCLMGCARDKAEPAGLTWRDLAPYPNPFGPDDANYAPQPHRDHPRSMKLSPDGKYLLVALQGSIDEPGDEVAIVDVASREVIDRVKVGRSPTGIAFHPDGRLAVVTNRYSNYLCVLDLETREVARHPVDYYLVEPLFDDAGRRLYATNRWRDAVQVWDVTTRGSRLELRARTDVGSHGIGVGINPRALALTADGAQLLVAARDGLTVSRIATDRLEEIDWDDDDPATTDFGAPDGVTRLYVGAFPHDLVVWRDRLYVPTLSASTFHPAEAGPDGDRDGADGDGTPNVGFADNQNEIAVFTLPDAKPLVRYTSDTICCPDAFDVGPDGPGGELLPPRSRWIVGGALPRAADAARGPDGDVLVVAYSGSNEVQRFEIGNDGTLEPGPVTRTGFQPMDVVVHVDRSEVFTLNRLADSITVLDLATFQVVHEILLGDVAHGRFPATDAEIGELYFHAGAAFTVDGDQTCEHCHPGRGNPSKPIALPILEDLRGSRMIPHVRGLAFTRPWLFEGFADEFNIFETVHEFARPENFPSPDFGTRDEFLQGTARAEIGRETSFGDAIDARLDFVGITRLLGLFLIHETALLPNPNSPSQPDVLRGKQLFESSETGCVMCHPPPGFTVTYTTNPFGTPLSFGPLVTPAKDADGVDIDRVNDPFLRFFPQVLQDERGVRLNPPTMLGIWDRAPPFLHDGRARNLRETLASPRHPALLPGERGFNEIDGMPDTHGGTSQLSPDELADLIAFLQSL